MVVFAACKSPVAKPSGDAPDSRTHDAAAVLYDGYLSIKRLPIRGAMSPNAHRNKTFTT